MACVYFVDIATAALWFDLKYFCHGEFLAGVGEFVLIAVFLN